MNVEIQSLRDTSLPADATPIFQAVEQVTLVSNAVEKAKREVIPLSLYWWATSGRDLSNMLSAADYPKDVRHCFLSFYQNTICPQLGNRPDQTSAKSGLTWDGSPFEYSFELKSSTRSQTVRFAVDLSQLRPGDKAIPLNIGSVQKVVNSLAERTPGFSDTWYRALIQYFDCSHLDASKQQALVAKVGYQTPVMLGFDIYSRFLVPGQLPALVKVYFTPCFVAEARGVTRWQVVSQAVRQLPDIRCYPKVLKSLDLIEKYLSDKPKHWEDHARYLATDFVAPGKARLKIYMRYPSQSFDEIWDYYTLGGQITGLEDDKEKIRDMINLLGGTSYYSKTGEQSRMDYSLYTRVRRKATVIYFSLSPDSPYPTPKIYFYPSSFAANDKVIAQGLDTWLKKYKWYDGEKSIEEQVKNTLYVLFLPSIWILRLLLTKYNSIHRKLDEKTGIFTFIAIGRKEDSNKKDLSIQVYVSPELYENPRYKSY